MDTHLALACLKESISPSVMEEVNQENVYHYG